MPSKERSVFLPCVDGLLIKSPLQGDLTPHLGKRIILTESVASDATGKLVLVSKGFLGIIPDMPLAGMASIESQIKHICNPYFIVDDTQSLIWRRLDRIKVKIPFK